MTNDVLVLDMNWQPVGFCSWQNAVKLWFEDRAKVVKEDEGGKVLHSPSFEMGMPRVIVVRNAWTRRKRQSVPCTRRNLLVRDNATCQYCERVVSTHEYTMDHIVPICQGGKSDWKNLVVSCMPCNKHKGGRTPMQAGMTLIAMPGEPKANDPKYNFKLHIRKMRPEWKEWESWLYWNAVIDKE
jgi:5-methylcytosine-specific restriction endonuclease McrA